MVSALRWVGIGRPNDSSNGVNRLAFCSVKLDESETGHATLEILKLDLLKENEMLKRIRNTCYSETGNCLVLLAFPTLDVFEGK